MMRFFKKDIKTSSFDYRTLFKYLPSKYRLKAGLALGSGGARGLTHLGAINALRSAGVTVEFVSGTSVGALVGAFFAAGKFDELVTFAERLTVKEALKMADIMFPTSGLVEGKRIERFLRRHLGSVRIEDLPIPFACVATDFYTGQEVILTKGDLVTAVRASISIPGVFKPVAVDDMLLVDGGVVNPLPVQVARDLGAEFVIAVDICPEIMKKMTIDHLVIDREAGDRNRTKKREVRIPNIFEIIIGSITIMESQIVDMRITAERPDVIIKPEVEDIDTFDFHRYNVGASRGESATAQVISKIGKYINVSKKVLETNLGKRPRDGTLT